MRIFVHKRNIDNLTITMYSLWNMTLLLLGLGLHNFQSSNLLDNNWIGYSWTLVLEKTFYQLDVVVDRFA